MTVMLGDSTMTATTPEEHDDRVTTETVGSTHVRVGENYRSVRDTGWFHIEQAKTILVGRHRTGQDDPGGAQRGRQDCRALRRFSGSTPPDGVRGFVPLPDYPRKLYNADIQLGRWQQPRWTLGHVITHSAVT